MISNSTWGKWTVAFVCVAGLGSLTTTAAGQQTTDADQVDTPGLTKSLEQYLGDLHDSGDFPGVSVAAILPNGQLVKAAVGVASADDETALTTDDVLFSGSIGKTYFAAMALQLMMQDKLDLDQKVSEFFGDEDWYTRIPNHADLTIRHLMTHQSGLPRYIMAQGFWDIVIGEPDKEWTNGEQLSFIYGAEPLHPAGDDWAYSDTNYVLLAMVLEKVADTSAYDYIDREFLQSHKLAKTYPTIQRTIPDLAQGSTFLFRSFGLEGETVRDGKYAFNPQFEWAGGGFASTTSDLAKWGWLFFSGKAFDGPYPELMKRNAVETGGQLGRDSQYGPGVIIRPSQLGTVLGHDGVFPGHVSSVGYFPRHSIAVAVQFNTDNGRSIGRPPHVVVTEVASLLSDAGDE